MPRTFFILLGISLFLINFLQPEVHSRVITFSARNEITLQMVALDSIRVQNQTQHRDTLLIGQTAFDLDAFSSVTSSKNLIPENFQITPNFPNSFDKETHFQVILPNHENIEIFVFNILGKRICHFEEQLNSGTHLFKFHGGDLSAGIYFVQIKSKNRARTIKMLKTGHSFPAQSRIEWLNNTANSNIFSQLNKTSIQNSDIFRFIGYAKNFYSDTLDQQIPQGGEDYQFKLSPVPPPPDFTSQWRGFNLQGKFTKEWSNQGYSKSDFQMIVEFGFNFVRLPIDYRTYTKPGDWNTFLEPELAEIDSAVKWGQKYGIHVCINLHRAPGYCVNAPSEPLPPAQDLSLWTSRPAQEVFSRHWEMFAKRYQQVPLTALSFNLVNEPANVDATTYVNAVKGAIDAIRSVRPDRIIISDGIEYGNAPINEILKYNVVISPHFYNPFQLTHYKAEWASGSDSWSVPQWPVFLMSSYYYGNWKSPLNLPLLIKGTFKSGTQFIIHVQQVSTKADFQVQADGIQVYRKDFVPGPGQGEWKEVIYRPEWNCYQNIYDLDYSFTLDRDARQISLQILEGDWMTFSALRIIPPANSGLKELVANPGITDWGVPPASYQLTNEGELLLLQAPAGFESYFIQNGFLEQWVNLKKQGVPVFVGEWGVYRFTPHDVTLRFMEDRLKAMKSAGLGWALWEFRGSFGVLNSERKDVIYENYRGNKLDRKMLELLKKY